ncbi:MAG: hypothetical protein LBE17_02245 [Treponema sp.]|nr:hypothetical protein [Treponema sp.]
MQFLFSMPPHTGGGIPGGVGHPGDQAATGGKTREAVIAEGTRQILRYRDSFARSPWGTGGGKNGFFGAGKGT